MEGIDRSLNEKGAIAYKAVVEGKMVSGAIVVIDEKTGHGNGELTELVEKVVKE